MDEAKVPTVRDRLAAWHSPSGMTCRRRGLLFEGVIWGAVLLSFILPWNPSRTRWVGAVGAGVGVAIAAARGIASRRWSARTPDSFTEAELAQAERSAVRCPRCGEPVLAPYDDSRCVRCGSHAMLFALTPTGMLLIAAVAAATAAAFVLYGWLFVR